MANQVNRNSFGGAAGVTFVMGLLMIFLDREVMGFTFLFGIILIFIAIIILVYSRKKGEDIGEFVEGASDAGAGLAFAGILAGIAIILLSLTSRQFQSALFIGVVILVIGIVVLILYMSWSMKRTPSRGMTPGEQAAAYHHGHDAIDDFRNKLK